MASMRVHELAKEFGMTSKELLDRLHEMKIPAKAHSSTLVDAYVDKIRKELGPELAERAAAVEAAAAEKEADAAQKEREEAENKAAVEQKEAERKVAEEAEHARREVERKQREEREAVEAAEKAERDAADAKRREEEAEAKRRAVLAHAEVARAEATAARVAASKPQKSVPERKPKPKTETPKKAPKKSSSRFDSLLSQIESEQTRMQSEAEKKKTAPAHDAKGHGAAHSHDSEAAHRSGGKKQEHQHKAEAAPAAEESGEDRYSRMAKDAEKFQRNKVLEEAKAAVEAATQEGEGRRKKRKAKREAEREAEKEAAIEEAILRGEDVVEEGTVKVPSGSTVAEFSELIDVPSSDVIKRLFLLGNSLTLTQTMSDDLMELIADDLGRTIKVSAPEDEEALVFYDDPKDLKPRPPVVTVMGHVDHGKTSLLDAIRKTGIAENEAGGITQHIGASVVNIKGRQITFIDTPGHEAFTAMRARGAKITDVVVLVVAADDGVMPQTVEAIHHAEAAGVPIVVAVNKIDKPGADPNRVRQELTAHGIIDEAWGGQNMFVEVSAKKRIGIDDLLETILLQSDVLELKANPDAPASGYVVEAKLDKGRGPVATMLVNRGTLRVGDPIVVGTAYGRVRAMMSPKGEQVTEALPADPVEVLGLSSVPDAGDEFCVMEDERDARSLADERALRRRLAAQNKTRISLDNLFERIEEGKLIDLNLVVKADVQGSIEALQDALDKMDQSEVKINVIHSAVGGITETDVTLAAASDAIIIGFNVRPQPKAKVAAEHEKVDIRTYRVIYEAIDDINQARVGLLQPDIVEKDMGSAEVRSLFKVPKIGVIAGSYVTDGEITRDDNVRIVRDGTVVHEGSIASLRRFKDDVKSVKSGYECGIGIDGFQDIKEGDVIEAYRLEEVARKE